MNASQQKPPKYAWSPADIMWEEGTTPEEARRRALDAVRGARAVTNRKREYTLEQREKTRLSARARLERLRGAPNCKEMNDGHKA
jgi:hypothetical protein